MPPQVTLGTGPVNRGTDWVPLVSMHGGGCLLHVQNVLLWLHLVLLIRCLY